MIKNDNPLVSIVIPTRNSEEFLEMTLKSILNQNYKKIELIVVDGQSSDGTHKIIEKYRANICIYICEKDGGMYEALNKGMRIASGDIFCYINSDDLLEKDAIQKIVDIFISNLDIDLIYGNLNHINEEGIKLFTKKYPKFNLKRFINSSSSTIGQPSSFWRAGLFKKLEGFNESYKMASDFDFYIRAGISGKIVHLNDILASHRLHHKSLTNTSSSLSRLEVRKIRISYTKPNIFSFIFIALNDVYFKIYNIESIFFKLKNIHK
jgi:glycosyltransferase involved in cell wall biosynthesis